MNLGSGRADKAPENAGVERGGSSLGARLRPKAPPPGRASFFIGTGLRPVRRRATGEALLAADQSFLLLPFLFSPRPGCHRRLSGKENAVF